MRNINKLIFSFFIFLVFVVLVIYDDLFIKNARIQGFWILEDIFYYIVHVGLLISGAHLFNIIFKIVFWDAIITKSLKINVPRLLIHFFSLLIYLITFLIIINQVFGRSLTAIWATSGVLALVLGFALRNMILDLFTGLAVNIERPYQIGDWIEINMNNANTNIAGRVIDINWRATRLSTEEEKIVIVPNSLLNEFVLFNYSSSDSKIRYETAIPIDYSVPIEQAKTILYTGAKKVLTEKGFFTEPEPNIIVSETNEFGIIYLVRYWINPWRGIYPTNARSVVNNSILDYMYLSGLRPSYPKEEVYFSRQLPKSIDFESTVFKNNIIKKVSLFNPLTDEERAELSEKIVQKNYNQGNTLIKMGDDGDSMFVLSEGLLDIRIGPDGLNSKKVGDIYPGNFFGEMSLLTGEKRSATITAVKDSMVFEIKKEHVKDLFRKNPEILKDITKLVAERREQNIIALENNDSSGDADTTVNFAQNLLNRCLQFFS